LHILLSNESIKNICTLVIYKTEGNAESLFLKWIKLWEIINEALLSALGFKVRLKLFVIEGVKTLQFAGNKK